MIENLGVNRERNRQWVLPGHALESALPVTSASAVPAGKLTKFRIKAVPGWRKVLGSRSAPYDLTPQAGSRYPRTQRRHHRPPPRAATDPVAQGARMSPALCAAFKLCRSIRGCCSRSLKSASTVRATFALLGVKTAF